MLDKEFVPYQEALELKELGFDEPCLSYWEGESFSHHLATIQGGDDYITPAPLYQQAFRWFRDKKLCDGSVCRHGQADGNYSYRWDILHEYGVYEERHFKQGYTTYEEAELACLKKLIEIIKNEYK